MHFEYRCSKVIFKHYTLLFASDICYTQGSNIFIPHILLLSQYFYKPVNTHVNRITTKCYSLT